MECRIVKVMVRVMFMECRIVKVMVRVMSWNVVLQRSWSELCHGMSHCKGHG